MLDGRPLLATADDHEILNNWKWGKSGPYETAIHAFNDFLGHANPPSDDSSTLTFQFSHGDVGIFVLDTRSFRLPGPHSSDTSWSSFLKDQSWPYDSPQRTMLGEKQLQSLLNWLLETKNKKSFKIIASSVPFSLNWHVKPVTYVRLIIRFNDDTWYGYQHERQRILDFITENDIRNIVFISGDRHQVAVNEFVYENWQTNAPLDNAGTMPPRSDHPPIVEFSVSPINQFSLPIPFHFETSNADNTKPGQSRFPDSKWVKDKVLFYSYTSGSAFGNIYIDTTGDFPGADGDPVLVFCLFGQQNGSVHDSSVPCDPRRPSSNHVPLYQYVVRGHRIRKQEEVISD